jgi:hypothetical protein
MQTKSRLSVDEIHDLVTNFLEAAKHQSIRYGGGEMSQGYFSGLLISALTSVCNSADPEEIRFTMQSQTNFLSK